jgi:redox-sensitive bicupin YhaK (pirin superfamily)
VSNLEPSPQPTLCGGAATADPVRELVPGREVVLGGTCGMLVTRTLPSRDRRMVGPWCFVDLYGPQDVTGSPGMRVPPHPHTGLQTVSWLLDGEVLHRDSLSSRQLIRPGELNLMTAGRAIAHSEETPTGRGGILHGIQLWVALPAESRHVEPSFVHHARLPAWTATGVAATVLLGELDGATSPARTYSPVVGAEVTLDAGADAVLPLRADFEYAALALSGDREADIDVDGEPLPAGPLLYLGSGRSHLPVRATAQPARFLLLGGEPFTERIVMWWNFVGRSHEEIVAFREDWMAGRGFGTVRGYDGEPLPAPPMPGVTLRPRARSRGEDE